MATAEAAFGITFGYADTIDGSYTSLGEISDLTPPSITKDIIETTNHGSTNGVKTYIGGLVDNGEASVTVNYDPEDAAHTAVRNLAKTAHEATSALKFFKFTFANSGASTEAFQGIVTGFEQSAPIDDKLSATFTIKVTGEVTYTA